MCSIIGFSRKSVPLPEMERCFARSKSRGPDMTRILETDKGYLGFHRLAIMGLTPAGMQPFALDGDLCVCNGELYGFRPIKKELLSMGYHFRSGSDCEIILPMYREYMRMMQEGHKKTYIVQYLSDEYDISCRNVYRVIEKFSSDVDMS